MTAETVNNSEIQVMSYRQAVRKIACITTGTLPLQITKAIFPITTALILSHSNEVAVRHSAVLISSCLDVVDIFSSPLHYVQVMTGNSNNPKDRENVGQVAHAGWLLAVAVSVPQVVILMLSKPMLDAFGQAPDVTSVVERFFNICAWTMPLHNLQQVSENVSLGTNKIYFPLVIQGCALSVFGLMAYPLAFGAWGAPNLGISGVACARLVRGGVYTLLSFSSLYLLSRSGRMFSPYDLFKCKRGGLYKKVKELCTNGGLVFLIMVSEISASYLINILVGRASQRFLTPQLIIFQYQDFILVFTSAIGSAAQNEISNNIKYNKRNIRKLGVVGAGLACVVPLIYLGFSIFSPTLLIRPFSDPILDVNTTTLLVDDQLFLISSFSNVLLAIRYVVTIALMGAGQLDWPLVRNVMLNWVGIGLGIALAFGTEYNEIFSLNLGVALGLLLSTVAQTINWVLKTREGVLEQVDPAEEAVFAESSPKAEMAENSGEQQKLLEPSSEGEGAPKKLLIESDNEERTKHSIQVLTESRALPFFSPVDERSHLLVADAQKKHQESRCVIL